MRHVLKHLTMICITMPLVVACASLPDVHEQLPPGQPKILLDQRTFGSKVVQYYSVETHVGQRGERLRSLYARVCDVDQAGTFINCKDTETLQKLNRIRSL